MGARMTPAAMPAGLRSSLPSTSVRHATAKSILTKTSGFIAEAGFSHSLTPARNCTYGCIYCYVPTMRFQGGLQPEDWRRWGQFTTFKSNAAELLDRAVRPEHILYCSPLVDPYQPAEESERLMPAILDVLIAKPPRVFVIQTRGPWILRDLEQLQKLSRHTFLKISFSLTTNRDDVRRLYEPLCAPIAERLDVMRHLRDAGISVYATLAPLLPCDPEQLANLALDATGNDIIADPFHTRAAKPRGATTRPEALRLSQLRGYERWHDPAVQKDVLERILRQVSAAGRRLGVGTRGFRWLAENEEGQPAF
jgi:DNA repair photolyase